MPGSHPCCAGHPGPQRGWVLKERSSQGHVCHPWGCSWRDQGPHLLEGMEAGCPRHWAVVGLTPISCLPGDRGEQALQESCETPQKRVRNPSPFLYRRQQSGAGVMPVCSSMVQSYSCSGGFNQSAHVSYQLQKMLLNPKASLCPRCASFSLLQTTHRFRPKGP